MQFWLWCDRWKWLIKVLSYSFFAINLFENDNDNDDDDDDDDDNDDDVVVVVDDVEEEDDDDDFRLPLVARYRSV